MTTKEFVEYYNSKYPNKINRRKLTRIARELGVSKKVRTANGYQGIITDVQKLEEYLAPSSRGEI